MLSSLDFSFVCVDGLSVFVNCMFLLCVSDAVCLLSCTLIKDVDFVSGRPGFQIPTPSFLLFFMFVWKKKKKSKWKLQASAGGWTEYRVPLFVWNKKFVASYIFTKYDWESTLKKKVACFTCGTEVETALHLSDQSFWSSKRQWQKCICTFVLFEFLSCTFRSVVQVLAWVSSRSRYRTAERVLYQWRK